MPEQPLTILGLDLGIHTGWARLMPGREPIYGTWNIGTDKVERLFKFADHVAQALEDHPSLDVVVYESVQFVVSRDQISLYAQLKALLEMECAARDVPTYAVAVGILKKWATGDHRAKKDQMRQAAMKMLGVGGAIMSDDEADAICLAFFGELELEVTEAA